MIYETNWRRILLAYIGGSFIAGILFAIGFFGPTVRNRFWQSATPIMLDWSESQTLPLGVPRWAGLTGALLISKRQRSLHSAALFLLPFYPLNFGV